MYRLPVAARVGVCSSLSCASRHCSTAGSSASANGTNYTKASVVVENRVGRWCRRLWALADERASAGAGVTASQAAEAISRVANGGPQASSAPPRFTTAQDLSAVSPAGLLEGLRSIVRADTSTLPAALAEAIWEVYDALLPPEVCADLHHTLNAETVDNFFSFVALLVELDFNIDAVTTSANNLQNAIAEYKDAVVEVEAQASEQKEVRVARAKRRLIESCFAARNAGSPLYYTWLRHTAAAEGGIRRLMQFRKTIHFFDVEGKKRINALQRAQQQQSGETADTAAATELHFWRKRSRDIEALDMALTYLFHDFFSKEYLIMEELTWFSTPPAMLQQIIRAEAVHPFPRGLLDMEARLQPTHHRHLYAFLHPAVVEEPLIAVQVALTKGIAGSVDYILGRPTPLADAGNATAHGRAFQAHLTKYGPDTADKERVDTAIFYSINSAQSALRGMDMGNMLIKRVVREVEEHINTSRKMRNLLPITNFSTLSPIPAYARWLSTQVEALNRFVQQRGEKADAATAHVPTEQCRIFGTAASPEELERRYFAPVRTAVLDYIARHELSDEALAIERLRAALDAGDVALANAQVMKFLIRQFLAPDLNDPWWLDHQLTAALERPLLRSVAHYLANEKKPRGGRIFDPVGNFHVSNGATIFRVNFLGNATAQGSRESACVMVNYQYSTSTIADNVTAYERNKTVALGDFMHDLLKNETD